MAQDIEPAVPRGKSKTNFSMGCLAAIAALIVAVGGMVVFVSGQVPAVVAFPVALLLAYFAHKKLKKVDEQVR